VRAAIDGLEKVALKDIEDFIEKAKEEGARMIIVLSHLGLDADKELAQRYALLEIEVRELKELVHYFL
jgi:2',3'-cyclic-nucleotide 2'-phosphodiesterase (5'-nucleotidase family)